MKPIIKITFLAALFILVFAALLAGVVFLFLYPVTRAQAAPQQAVSQAAADLVQQQPGGTGIVSGEISFPSEQIPAMVIYAFRIDNSARPYSSLQTSAGQSTYRLRLDPGVYQLVAYYQDLAGGYTQAVLCGLAESCQDHSLVPVTVKANQIVQKVDLKDWYAPPGAFPAKPDAAIKPGAISGQLSFPGEVIPAMNVYAFKAGQLDRFYKLQTKENQRTYSIAGLEPGEYYVVAYFQDRPGGYTQAVLCGLTIDCTDHTLLAVKVGAGETVRDIHLQDWYAPDKTFPAQPSSQATCRAHHTVQRGETLYRIGLRYGIDWPSIAKINRLADPNLIYTGQVLCIPSASIPGAHEQFGKVPLISIASVSKDESVTIRTSDFPAGKTFVVTMGVLGTQGIGGLKVAETNSGSGGSFTVTYAIPAALRGEQAIAIRLESRSGYYSYNWFYNR